jgi:hypothetical protein
MFAIVRGHEVTQDLLVSSLRVSGGHRKTQLLFVERKYLLASQEFTHIHSDYCAVEDESCLSDGVRIVLLGQE